MDDQKNGIKAYQKAAMILAAKHYSSNEARENNAKIAAKNAEEAEKAIERLKNLPKKKLNSAKTAKNFENSQFTPVNIAKKAFVTDEFKQKFGENQKIQMQKIYVPQKKGKIPAKSGESRAKNSPTVSANLENPSQKSHENGFVRTTLDAGKKSEAAVAGEGDSAVRKVAKFLFLIGSDRAAKILPLLPADRIDEIASEIATIRAIGEGEAARIFAEFDDLGKKSAELGGPATAKNILTKAFGAEKAESLWKKTGINAKNPFDDINSLSDDAIFSLLQNESVSLKAIAISQISPQKAANVIKLLEADEKAEVVHRLARLRDIDARVLTRFGRALAEKSRSLVDDRAKSIDGRAALSEILRKMPCDVESRLLENIGIDDSELESDLRSRLFTLDDIPKVEDDFIQKTLSAMGDEKIALLIAGKSETFREKILKNISKNRQKIVLEEEAAKKPMKKSDVSAATDDFFAVVKKAREAGEIRVEGFEGEVWV